MKYTAILLSLFVAGCATKTVFPQKFYSQDLSEAQRATVLNFYDAGQGFYVVKTVDNEKVGNVQYGPSIVHELLVAPGLRKLSITISISKTSIVTATFNGDLSCETRAGKFYTIEIVGDIEKIKQDTRTRIPAEIACKEYAYKPYNPALSGKTISSVLFDARQ